MKPSSRSYWYLPALAVVAVLAVVAAVTVRTSRTSADVVAGQYSMEVSSASGLTQTVGGPAFSLQASILHGFGEIACDTLKAPAATPGCYQAAQWYLDYDETRLDMAGTTCGPSCTSITRVAAAPASCTSESDNADRWLLGCLDLGGAFLNYSGPAFNLNNITCIAPGTATVTILAGGSQTFVNDGLIDEPIHVHSIEINCVGGVVSTATPTNTVPVPTSTPTNTVPVPTSTPTSTSEVPTSTPTSTSEVPTSTPTSTSEVPTSTPTSTSEVPTSTPTSTSEVPTSTPTSTSEVPTSTPTSTSVVPTHTPTATITAHTPTVLPTNTFTPTPISGDCLDLNGDGRVTGLDVAIVARAMGDTGGEADVNVDGEVDVEDLHLVIQSMHQCRTAGNGNAAR